jgi:alpha-L-fucosidase 2
LDIVLEMGIANRRSAPLSTAILAAFVLASAVGFRLGADAGRRAPAARAEETRAGTDDGRALLKLWYRRPAAVWNEALPIGNGRLGAMVYGGLAEECLQLNESTVWTGGPYDPANRDALKALPEVRRLVFAGRYREAQELYGRRMMARPPNQQKYQPLGDLWIRPLGLGRPTDQNKQLLGYRRELDLDTAIAAVRYTVGGVNFTREVFASPADQVIVVRLAADKPGRLSFAVRLTGRRNELTMDDTYARITEVDGKPVSSPGDETSLVEGRGNDTLVLTGRTATYLGIPGRVAYEARAKVIAEGGRVSVEGDAVTVMDADAATILVPAATNFRSYKDLGGDPAARVAAILGSCAGKAYVKLRDDHIAEHRRLFRRLSLTLPRTENSALPTDERLRRFQAGAPDPDLAALYFQFGRYLLLSSSRPGSVPANLQGIWNDTMNPAWGSKYTTNINLEMNYWPALPAISTSASSRSSVSSRVSPKRDGRSPGPTTARGDGCSTITPTSGSPRRRSTGRTWARGRAAERGSATSSGTGTCSPETGPTWSGSTPCSRAPPSSSSTRSSRSPNTSGS